jgi:hypothetical protein
MNRFALSRKGLALGLVRVCCYAGLADGCQVSVASPHCPTEATRFRKRGGLISGASKTLAIIIFAFPCTAKQMRQIHRGYCKPSFAVRFA